MYLYLLHQCNIRRWINPFEFKTRDLEFMLGLSRNSIGAIRNKLKQRGLLEFAKGVGSGSAVYFITGAKVTNQKLYEEICVKSEDTMVNTTLHTTVNTTLNTTVNTNANPTLLREERRKKTKDTNVKKGCARVPVDGGLFSESEMERLEPKGVKASKLSAFTPPSSDEVLAYFRQQRADTRLPEWENEAITFFNYYNSQDWVKSNGRKVSSWESLANDWIMRKERETKQTKPNERASANRRPAPEDTLAAEQSKLAGRIMSRRNRQGVPGGYGDRGEIP